MRGISAKYGHITRRLVRNERLTGKVLEFALSVVNEGKMSGDDDLFRGIAEKVTAGQQLSEYELHIMIDVLLPHKRLGHRHALQNLTGHEQ